MEKNIQFTTQNSDFIRELREEVNAYFKKRNLSKYGNTSIVVKSLFMLSLYAVPYILMITGIIHSLTGLFISWSVMGFGMAGLGMVLMHDSNHGSFSKNHKINKWFGKSLYLLGGFPPSWKHQHNTMHHGFTNIFGYDEDIKPVNILRFSPHKKHHRIHKFQHFYAWFFYGLMTFSWVTMKDFKQLINYKKRNVHLSSRNNYTEFFTDLIFSKLLYYLVMLVIPILVLSVPWYTTLVLFFIMHFISGLILGTIFQTAHVVPTSSYPLPDENGNVENDWAIHQLYTTSDFSPGSRIMSWLIGGLNFQVEHHLFPNISHVHYRNLSPIVKETAHKYNLPYSYQPNFFKAVYSHFKMMRMLGVKNKS